MRDYIHITDLATAHISALEFLDSDESLKNRENFEIFNVGTGKSFSVFKSLESMKKLQVKILNSKF